MSFFYIAKKINERFGLYRGLRPKEKDDLIFENVSRQCFFEMVRFLDERLSDKQKIEFEKKLAVALEEESDKAMPSIFNTFIVGKEQKILLRERLESFIDNLFFATLNKLKDGKSGGIKI